LLAGADDAIFYLSNQQSEEEIGSLFYFQGGWKRQGWEETETLRPRATPRVPRSRFVEAVLRWWWRWLVQ
jgi:hypothetical protein